MNASDLMTKEVHSCLPQDELQRAAQLMWEHDCGIVPVVDPEQHVIGVITDRDICMAAYSRGQPLREIPVTVAASRAAHSVRPDTPIGGNLVGFLSLADIVRNARPPIDEDDALGFDKVAATLESVYRSDDALPMHAVGA